MSIVIRDLVEMQCFIPCCNTEWDIIAKDKKSKGLMFLCFEHHNLLMNDKTKFIELIGSGEIFQNGIIIQ